MTEDLLQTKMRLESAAGVLHLYSLAQLQEISQVAVERLPCTIKILVENVLRRGAGAGFSGDVSAEDVMALARWPVPAGEAGIPFMPSRVLMQDFTGVPAVVDLAALRSAVSRAGGDPRAVNPSIPVDLVIDHSVQVDRFGSPEAYDANIEWEYRRNRERYSLLNWAQQAFEGFRVVPPGMGICHQVNLEYLSLVVAAGSGLVFPDTVLGTDSHTTMINGLGILGWGVGGIEAEAAMLGQPMFLSWPQVVGIRTKGQMPPGTTATDLVLTLTQMLRDHGVVGKFVEFFGDGLSSLKVADRATLSNMSPEFGATASLFPVDDNTLEYLSLTGRGGIIPLVDAYTKQQGLFRRDGDRAPVFDEVLELDLSAVEPSLAGPSRPQDRVSLAGVKDSFAKALTGWKPKVDPREIEDLVTEGGNPAHQDLKTPVGTSSGNYPRAHVEPAAAARLVSDGSVVISAITSCTNTSNPTVMLAAGLLAKKAVEAGLSSRPWVKTSLAPGSRVVTSYLEKAGLLPYLEKLGFNLVGYGCTTCIGNSGPLPEEVAEVVNRHDLSVVAVLSGNRNFEGRIHPQVRASYLASPPLCVAYAIAGRIDADLTQDPVGVGHEGKPVFLSEIWPSPEELEAAAVSAVSSDQFAAQYGGVFKGDEKWRAMPAPSGAMYKWEPESTYVQEPPYFRQDAGLGAGLANIAGARVLVFLGDSVTTDHISPAGAIRVASPAGRYLIDNKVAPQDFNSFGARRGNHQVMIRGTFGNARLRNKLTPEKEGPWTSYQPDGEVMAIYDAAERYRQEGIPLVVLAGKEYGSGSSRDWAAKGTALLGVKAVLAESYERIHRSNLVGMGVLPLQFEQGQSPVSLGLTGRESFFMRGMAGLKPKARLGVTAVKEDGSELVFETVVRIDTPAELDYYKAGGILQMVLGGVLETAR